MQPKGLQVPSYYNLKEEVKVQLQNHWPDYVFAETYRLPSLDEVKKNIAEKDHRINVPSAKEVEVDGIELGKTNRLFPEKTKN